MKIAGIVAEYNPFHEGHRLHIEKTRELTGCDFVIAVMSASFVQRGRAAMFDKFTRARAALSCGADAVFELPALWSLSSAKGFASAGVEILCRLGADVISCGVEKDATELAGRLPVSEPESLSRAVREGLGRGEAYAAAWGKAAAEYLGVPAERLKRPNLILMHEYRKAAEQRGVPVVAVPRESGYHETGEGVLSAEAVRELLRTGRPDAAKALLPEAARFQADAAPLCEERLDAALLWRLRALSREEFAAVPGCAEGLEHRLYEAVRPCSTVEEAAEAVKCKRYTRTRIDRLLLNAALGITADFAAAHPLPEYARLLGFRRGARELLTELNARAGAYPVTDPKALRTDPVFLLENRATDLWFTCRGGGERCCDMDYKQKMLITE